MPDIKHSIQIAAAPESLFLMMTMTGWLGLLAASWGTAEAAPRVADERSIERTAQPPPMKIEAFMIPSL